MKKLENRFRIIPIKQINKNLIFCISLCFFLQLSFAQNNILFNDILLQSLNENTALNLMDLNGEAGIEVQNLSGDEQMPYGFMADIEKTEQVELAFDALSLSQEGSLWSLGLNANSGFSPGKLVLEQLGGEAELRLEESMYLSHSVSIKLYEEGNLSGDFYTTAEMLGVLTGSQKIKTLGVYPNEGNLSYWIEFDELVSVISNTGDQFTGDEMEIVIMNTPEIQNFDQFSFVLKDQAENFLVEHVQGKYPEPQIFALNPSLATTGEQLTVDGENLSDISQVAFSNGSGNGVVNADFIIIDDNTLELTVPASATTSLQLTSFYGAKVETPITIVASCKLPSNLLAKIQRTESETAANLTWVSQNVGASFEVQYRALGGSSWISDYVTANNLVVSGLQNPAQYEWRVKEVCDTEFSAIKVFSTDYGNSIYVSEAIHNRVQQWIKLGEESDVSIFDFMEDDPNLDPVELTSFFLSYTNGDWPAYPVYSGPCYCKTIQVHTAIQVEPGKGKLNLDAKEFINYVDDDNKGSKRHTYREYKIDHGPAFHMKYAFSGHRVTKNEKSINLHKGTVPPNFSKMSMTYICSQNGVKSTRCGCLKELDIDVRYDSNHWLDKTKASQKKSEVKSKTEEYAFIYTVEQPSNDLEVLYADFAGKKMMDKVSWNPQAFINIVELAAIIAKAGLAGNITSQTIDSVKNVLDTMIVTPFQIRDFAASGQQGIGIGGKRTLYMRPNTTRTIAMYSNGSIYAQGKGRGKSRWHATAEIHSNYRMSMVFEPRPTIQTPWCCTQSIGMWDLGSLGWRAPKTKAELRNSVGAHLVTYHSALDWIGLNTFYYGGIHHLDLKDNRYYRVVANSNCLPYQAPPSGWDWRPGYYQNSPRKAVPLTSGIAPNPFSVVTTINYELPEQTQRANLIIYNLNGVKMKRFSLSNNSNNIHISADGLASGLYYYTIYADGKQISTNKMIIQK